MECKLEFRKLLRLKTGEIEMTFDECHHQFERFLYTISRNYENTGYPKDEF